MDDGIAERAEGDIHHPIFFRLSASKPKENPRSPKEGDNHHDIDSTWSIPDQVNEVHP